MTTKRITVSTYLLLEADGESTRFCGASNGKCKLCSVLDFILLCDFIIDKIKLCASV